MTSPLSNKINLIDKNSPQKLNRDNSPNKQQIKLLVSSPKKLFTSSSSDSPFYTQIHQGIKQGQQLNDYINNLKNKIKNALWKQQLLLSYNYMPLQTIKQKIQHQRNNYLQKINNFKDEYKKVFQNSQFTQQLQNLRAFNQKLKQKMKQYQIKIQQSKVKNSVLKVQTDQKKQKLKQMIKYNMQLSKSYAQKLGANKKEDLVQLIRTRSVRSLLDRKRNSFMQSNSKPTKLQSLTLRRSSSAKLIEQSLKKTLFEECLDKLIASIKGMRTSEDIQSGIYLQIMNRKKSQYSTAGKLSHRSSINNTLLERYAPRIKKQNNKNYQQNDFDMDWQTFKQLNWKQMLGIMLVKDPNCTKLKTIFKSNQDMQSSNKKISNSRSKMVKEQEK